MAIYAATNGNSGPVPREALGTLHRRLHLVGATDDMLREAGDSFERDGMIAEAIAYVHEVWERTPHEVVVSSSGAKMRNDIADAWSEQTRRREHRKSVGFAEPRPAKCTIPPPERSIDRDHRHSRRILREWRRERRNGGEVTMYLSHGAQRNPQVTALDEREWSSDFEQRLRRSQGGHKQIVRDMLDALKRAQDGERTSHPRCRTEHEPNELLVVDVWSAPIEPVTDSANAHETVTDLTHDSPVQPLDRPRLFCGRISALSSARVSGFRSRQFLWYDLSEEGPMKRSVLQLAEQAMRSGCSFERNPWTGRATLLHQDGVPKVVLDALTIRWGDVEAILNEQSPPTKLAVSIAERLLIPWTADATLPQCR